MKKSLYFLLFIFSLSLISVISSTGCANIIPPSGGPRDSLPPVLLRAEPADSTLNFRSNRIVLRFNEFVDLQDLSQNIQISPSLEVNPPIEVRLNTITIRFRDSLEANTTYTIDFGNAIRDINEGNILPGFSYSFSTGNKFDEGELRGKVTLAETGGIDSTLVVVLHRNLEDSAVRNSRPRYITRLDNKGEFVFRNLPEGTFAVYAIGDAAITRRYTSPTQLFAFANAPVTVTDSASPSINLLAYRETIPTSNQTGINLPGRISGSDRRLRYITNLTANKQDLLKSFIMDFERPLQVFDTAKMALYTDSTFTPVANYTISLDSSRKRMELTTAWKENTLYNLILQQDFAVDSSNRTLLKGDTLSFTTRKLNEYGSVNIRITNVDSSQNPVLQFVQNNKVVLSAPVSSGRFTQNLFLPGDYELRILFDENNNGVWDPGQFFGIRKQPEIIRPIEKRLAVKAAFDNVLEISL